MSILGQFAYDKANGYGKFSAASGAKYEGQWRDNIQEGYGIEIWPDGARYEGYYKNGKKEGYGREYLFLVLPIRNLCLA